MRRPRRELALLVLAACGGGGAAPPDAEPSGTFELVGTSDLGARGMNAALAVAGDTVYVGSRIDDAIAGRDPGILIVDVADPAHPSVVGSIGPPDEGLGGMSSRELRAVGNTLIVLNLQCSPDLHGCRDVRSEVENLKLYDITDRHAPVLRATYPINSGVFCCQRDPHEMFVWQDPADPARVLVYLTTPPGHDSFEVVDVSDPATPTKVVSWDPIGGGGLNTQLGPDDLLHSVSATPDGRTAWFSHLQGGLFAVDLSDVVDGVVPPVLRMITPPDNVLRYPSPVGPHSAVPVPGRPLLVVTDEVYPQPIGVGCPFGWMHLVDVSDPTTPMVVGEYQVDGNRDCGDVAARTTYTAHNATVTENLALVSWHSAGLEAIDITDPTAPSGIAEWRPDPLPSVAVEDPALGGNPVTVWSYPVIQDGLIYVIDIRNGLSILRYTGPLQGEVTSASFDEGNSNR